MSNLIPAWIDGVLTPYDKLSVHQQGLKHLAASISVISEANVLIQQRALSKYHTPGLWANTCCTHPHWQEAPQDCARRRLDEELGITGLALKHRHNVEYRADVGNGMSEHELVDVFVAEAGTDQKVSPNSEEVADTAWISFQTLIAEVAQKPEKFTPWLRIYLESHLTEIFGASFGR